MILGATPLELLGVSTTGAEQIKPNPESSGKPKAEPDASSPKVKAEPGGQNSAIGVASPSCQTVASPNVKSSPK